MMHALIVDDEKACSDRLSLLVKKYCPDVQIVACCNSAAEAIPLVQQHQPLLIFLDTSMPGTNGFEMLDHLPSANSHVIFISDSDACALKAFGYNAIDFLLKPVQAAALERAVQKARIYYEHTLNEQLVELLQKVNHLYHHSQIALPTLEGLQMVNIDHIISCTSDSNYTKVFLKNNQKIVVSKTLGDIEEMLHDYAFIRVHHSYLVNINEINKYIKSDGGYLVMNDGSTIDVSRNKKDVLIKKLTHSKK